MINLTNTCVNKVVFYNIRDLLGHSSITTTEVYARTDAKLKRKAIEAASKNLLPDEEAKWDNNANLKMWLKSFDKR